MYGQAYEIYQTIDPAKKNAIWADQCITLLRRDWTPLVNQVRMRENKQFLDSMQGMEWIKGHFKDKAFKKMIKDFDPIGIMEAVKNTLIEDIMKSPPKAELKATDPSAISQRKKDILLLKNKRIVEDDLNKFQSQVYGEMPKYKYSPKNFQSNVDEFGKLNLNPNDPEDMTFYELNLQRLNYEIAGQIVINTVLKLCRYDEDTTMKLVRDILSAKTVCTQVYVDKLTGEIKCRYVAPETLMGIFGDKGDGSNDICNGWVDNISINEWLQLVGNEFNWERDWRKLIWAINYCGSTKYTGFIRSGIRYDCCGNSNWMEEGGMKGWESSLLEWTMAFNYQINCGYIEWKTEEATKTFVKNDKYKNYVDEVPYDHELSQKQALDGYYKESDYKQQTYSSYFISTTSVSQWIFGFGKLYYQQMSGANDEYSSGSIKYYMLPGKSAVEIARPYIKMANLAFYKMLWTIDKAKPEDEVYVMEELVQQAKAFMKTYPQSSANAAPKLDTIIDELINYQRVNFVKLRSYPQVEGRTIPQLPPLEGRKNGLDPVYISMQAVLIFGEQQVYAKIGINPMRVGMNPPPRESQKTEMNTVEFSMNATSYIYRMMQYQKERVATTVLTFTQDIINFQDSIPYNWLKTIMGEEEFGSLFLLKNFAAHRFGIFVGDYNSDYQKQRVIQAADMAFQQGKIEIDQWGMITQEEDYKKGLKLLALYKRKAEKKERMQALQDMKVKQEAEEAADKREMAKITLKGKLEIEKEKVVADGLIQSATIASQGRIKIKEMTVDAEGPKQADKSQATQEINTSKEKDKESKPFPAVAGGQ